jgi:hypothetical protein
MLLGAEATRACPVLPIALAAVQRYLDHQSLLPQSTQLLLSAVVVYFLIQQFFILGSHGYRLPRPFMRRQGVLVSPLCDP